MRRHLWALDLLALGTVALVAAHATSLAAGAALLRLAEDSEPPAVAPPMASVPEHKHPDEAIVRRNIFCSSCRAQPRGEGEARALAALPLRLLAIMYAAPPADPRQSVAVIKDERGASGAYVVGASLGAATVEVIDGQRVSLRLPDGRLQVLTLTDQPSGERPAPADPLVAELDAGIKQIGENHYGVQRATVESLLAKLDALGPQARLEPDVREGKAIGFRLRDVKEGGVFAKIGLRDGDLIASVNGLATNGPDNALAIYTSLRSGGHLSVALERAGRPLTTEYDIQ